MAGGAGCDRDALRVDRVAAIAVVRLDAALAVLGVREVLGNRRGFGADEQRARHDDHGRKPRSLHRIAVALGAASAAAAGAFSAAGPWQRAQPKPVLLNDTLPS